MNEAQTRAGAAWPGLRVAGVMAALRALRAGLPGPMALLVLTVPMVAAGSGSVAGYGTSGAYGLAEASMATSENAGLGKRSTYIEPDDGVLIATDIFIPGAGQRSGDGSDSRAAFPAVFSRTLCCRSKIDLISGAIVQDRSMDPICAQLLANRSASDCRLVQAVIDLDPTSWIFKPGHRIRISIAGADWPTFRLHPELAPSNQPDHPENILPTIFAYRGWALPSHIELPIVSGRRTTAGGGSG